jgi:hypothetical protein
MHFFSEGFFRRRGRIGGKALASGLAVVAASLLYQGRPAFSSGESPADRVYVIAANANQKLAAQPVPVPEYTRFLSTAMGSVNESIKPVLEKRSAASQPQPWGLNSIGVGLGLNGQIGLGPIINVTVQAGLRLVFSDSKNPIYPN